jgi:nucleoside-diphosphate-sugar epimerase
LRAAETRMSKKVAVTGGAGRLGKYICDEFLASGWSVLSIDVVPSGGTATANANAAGALTTLMADLTDPGQAYAALAGCDAVVHMGERTLLLCFCFAAPCSVL